MALTTFHNLNNIFDIIDGIDKFDNNIFLNKYDNMFFKKTLPAVDLKENNMDYIVTVDAPGLDKNNIKISIDHGKLNISYERMNETENTNDRVHFSEKRYGKTSRTINLPKNIIEEGKADSLTEIYRKINLVSAQDILSVANEVLSPANLSSLTFLPES